MRKLYEYLIAMFVLVALYTPLLWYISILRKRYSSFGFWELNFPEKIVYSFLIVIPLICIFYLDKHLKRRDE